MTIGENAAEFDGLPVVDYQQGMTLNPENSAYRLRWNYGDEFTFGDLFAAFLASDGVERVTGLITGSYSEEMYDESDSMASVIETVVSAAGQLPNLTGLFLGDMTFEEIEISWIWQSDISPVWSAFPRLRNLIVRGGQGLSLGDVVHDQLQSLTVQTGGLGQDVIAQIAAAKLPELKHLEVWLGEDNYGGDSTLDDVLPLMEAERFPELSYLGIKNSTYQDEIAAAVAQASILPQLETLDLSMGTLTDSGAEALLAQPDRFRSLKKLDVSHHFLSNEMMERLQSLPCQVDISDQQDADVDGDEIYRYIAVSE